MVVMRTALPVLLLAALGLCGCGHAAGEPDVRTITTRFLAAVGHDAGSIACAQLTRNAVQQVEQQEQGSCAKSIGQLKLVPARVVAVELYGDNAKADLANGASVFAERTLAGWRISDAGCRATQGDPRSHPMNCELES
jgi:hypothetical protein